MAVHLPRVETVTEVRREQPAQVQPQAQQAGLDIYVPGDAPFRRLVRTGASVGAAAYLSSNAAYDSRGIKLCRTVGVLKEEACQDQRGEIVSCIEAMAQECVEE